MMKKIFSLVLVCSTLTVFAQKKWNSVKGSGNVQTESRSVGSFTAIDSHGSFDVDIQYGSSNAVQVEADDNLLPLIITKVEGDKLIITTANEGFSSAKKLQVHVTMAKVTALMLSGNGNITGKGAFNNDGTTKISSSGSGNIRFGFSNMAAIDASVRGSGNVELNGGQVAIMMASAQGSGNINAYNVECKKVTAETSGSGNVKVTASESISAISNGSGSVYYKGNATVISAKSNGSGRVIKAS